MIDTAAVEPAWRNKISDRLRVRLDPNSGDLMAEGLSRFTGFAAMDVQRALGSAKAEVDRLAVVRGFVLKGDNNFQLLSYTLRDYTQGDSVVEIEYSFVLPKWVLAIDGLRYFKPDLMREKNFGQRMVERKSPLELEYALVRELHLEIAAEHGLAKAELLPDKILEVPGARFEQRMLRQGTTLVFDQRLELSKIRYETVEMAGLEGLQTEIRKAGNRNIEYTFIP
ncbi:hypothetical protein GC167_09030 [bacterium]|nr:hypothetical protein [bacterium]